MTGSSETIACGPKLTGTAGPRLPLRDILEKFRARRSPRRARFGADSARPGNRGPRLVRRLSKTISTDKENVEDA